MRILVHHQGQQLGPFTVEQLRAALAAGTVSAQDLAWWEGQATWVPVTTVPGLGVVASGGAAPVVTASGDGSTLAVWSLILGILSLILCGFFAGIPGVICGHMALARKSRAGVQQGKGIAIAGLATGYTGVLLGTIMMIAVVASIAIPVFGEAQTKAKLTQSMNHARQISIALNFYANSHQDAFPPTLQELDEFLPDKSALTDPLAPEFGKNGYIYIVPGKGDPPDKVVVVSRGKTRLGLRAVAFKDGSARSMPYSLPADL